MSLTKALEQAKARFKLDLDGVHGPKHWERVQERGLRIASMNGGNQRVVSLFAVLHDCCREDEDEDPLHGERAAEFALELWHDGEIQLAGHEFAMLYEAIRNHSKGLMSEIPTIQACWDADRLDLPRVGITPAPRFLSPAGRALLSEGLFDKR